MKLHESVVPLLVQNDDYWMKFSSFYVITKANISITIQNQTLP